MGYTVKLQNNVTTSRRLGRMAQSTRTDEHDRASESKFYLPVGVTPPFEAVRVQRVWDRLFSHQVQSSDRAT